MKRALFFVFLSVSALTVAAIPALAVVEAQGKLAQNDLSIETDEGEMDFTVEVAITPEEQQTGLMNRTSLAEDEGMLFVLPHDRKVEMWMKDTVIPLDMVFIDSAGDIATIAESTTPMSLDVITPTRPVHAVLELAGGTCAREGIKEGDHVTNSYFHP